MDEEKPSPFADLLTGAAFLALATAIVVASWRMDRLAHLHASIFTVPGLVPGLLGCALGIMALLLMARGVRGGGLATASFPAFRLADHWRLIAVLGLCLIYAIGLVAHGLPFWLASAIFVTAFILVFQFAERRSAGTLARGAGLAIFIGLTGGLVVHYSFQNLFLVRLP